MTTVARVADWFGLSIRIGKSDFRIGHPPTHVSFDRDGVIWIEQDDVSPGDVLHECVHAVLGPYTLTEECGLMAYERACARLLLHGEDWRMWRSDFAEYALSWGNRGFEIGHGDDAFKSEEWIDACHGDAIMRGWLEPDGSPVHLRGLNEGYL